MLYLREISVSDVLKSVKIFINNNWIGIHFDPYYIYRLLLNLRRIGVFHKTISISWYVQENEIHILADAGRVLRPLYIVKNNDLLLDKNSILNNVQNDNFEWKDLLDKKNSYNLRYKKTHLENFKNSKKKDKSDKDSTHKTNNLGNIDFSKFDKSINLIEYIDIEESNNSLIAMNRKYLDNKSTY